MSKLTKLGVLSAICIYDTYTSVPFNLLGLYK